MTLDEWEARRLTLARRSSALGKAGPTMRDKLRRTRKQLAEHMLLRPPGPLPMTRKAHEKDSPYRWSSK